MAITQIEYANDKIYSFDRQGNDLVLSTVPFHTHFWVSEEYAPNLAGIKCFSLAPCKETSIDGRKLVQVNVLNYFEARKIEIPKEHSFERDVVPENRFILDNEIKFDPNCRILYLDIETKDCRDPLLTPDPIICIGLIDGFTSNEYQFVWRENLTEETKIVDKRTIFYFNSEVDMINAFFNWLKINQFDIVTCWNSPFDIPFIINRSNCIGVDSNKFSPVEDDVYHKVYCGEKESQYNKFGDKSLTFKIFGLMTIDLLKLYRKINVYNVEKADSFKLDDVAKFVLNEQKLKHGKFAEMWDDDLEKLLEYNMRDVELIYRLEKKLTLITGYLRKIQDIVGAQLDDCMQNSKVIDFYVIRTFKNKYHFPSKKHIIEGNRRMKFEGAFVKLPDFKLYKNVGVFDYSGMYPNIIRTFNISPDTKVTDVTYVGKTNVCDNCTIVEQQKVIMKSGVKWNKISEETRTVKFRKDFEGIFTQLVSKMIETRAFYKNKWQTADKNMSQYSESSAEYKHWLGEKINWKGSEDAQKALINSFFGVTGYQHFRFFDIELGGSVTAYGRKNVGILKDMIEGSNFENNKYSVIYQDTDSCFFVCDKDMPYDEFCLLSERLLDYVNQNLPTEIKNQLNENYDIKKGWIKVDIAYIFKSLQFVGVKKRYAGILQKMKKDEKTGLIVKKDILYARGFELIKKDTPQFFKEKLSELFWDILLFKDRSSILEKMRGQLKEIRKLETRQFGMPKNFSKNIEDYTGNTQHVRALKWCNSNIGTTFDSTDALSLYFVKNKNNKLPETDVIVLDNNTDFPNDLEIDYERYFDFFVIKKLKDLVNIQSKEILFTRSLFDFC